MRGNSVKPPAANQEAGFGLLSTVLSLLIVALLTLGALKAFAGGTGTGSGSQALSPTVARAYDVQAQSALSNVLQNVRDDAIANGGLSALELAPFGVTSGPSRSPSVVSGAESSGADGAGGPAGSGSVTLAVESASRTCWYVWFSASDTWFGFEPNATVCTARPQPGPPTPGAGAPGTIGWQQGSFQTSG